MKVPIVKGLATGFVAAALTVCSAEESLPVSTPNAPTNDPPVVVDEKTPRRISLLSSGIVHTKDDGE